jgi:hypothetical protein
VRREELTEGCLRRDCIPSIDNPKFESVSSADGWLEDEDRVFGLVYMGVERAYPQKILNRHDIVNDKINGVPVAMTFYPLYGTTVAFIREVNGKEAEFGISGLLHNSDLVLYDREEGNLWKQITAEAIVGPAARRDERLEVVDAVTTTWAEWKSAHPGSEILSRPKDTGIDYDVYPYVT